MDRLKRHGPLLLAILILLFNFFTVNFCQAQYSTYTTVPQIIFKESGVKVLVYSKYFSVTDSIQAIKLSVSVYNNTNPYYLDSIRFNLKGTDKLKMVSSSNSTYETTYPLEYVFKRIPEPFPPLTLEVYSSQKFLGAIKLMVDNNFIRLGLVNPNDSLSSYTYGSGCIYINPVKQLVGPKLPENNNRTNKFKHQVKSSKDFKLQER